MNLEYGGFRVNVKESLHLPSIPVDRRIHREARFLADPVERLGRVVFCAISIRDRSALFTASSFGKA
jgi:hypothetical protein